MDIPVLETERLILRGHRREDFPDYLAMWADPDVTRFIGGKPFTEEESWARFMRAIGHWALLGFGFWSVHEKDGGARVGEAGFLDVRRDIVPSMHDVPEMGWAFAKSAQGKGYATEAVRAAITWGESHFGKTRFACIIAPENAPSLNVAAKMGFREAARTTYKGEPTVMLYREP
ncbi:MAG TPA: GNAT family N-acetyltransferase [Rhizomicrobium sp.]|jgi:RimJ/RimL family protein N-acetyltransferase|nr:GNAT family N-acetyltransferase [Rhizomicrobium sp.]